MLKNNLFKKTCLVVGLCIILGGLGKDSYGMSIPCVQEKIEKSQDVKICIPNAVGKVEKISLPDNKKDKEKRREKRDRRRLARIEEIKIDEAIHNVLHDNEKEEVDLQNFEGKPDADFPKLLEIMAPSHLTEQEIIDALQKARRKGASFQGSDDKGWTLLHWAAFFEYQECLTFFCNECGLSVNSSNKEGNTPLHVAVLRHNEGLVRCLLDLGALPTIKNNNRKTALECLCSDIDFYLRNPKLLLYYCDEQDMSASLKQVIHKKEVLRKHIIELLLEYTPRRCFCCC
jgi:hypothetical protein